MPLVDGRETAPLELPDELEDDPADPPPPGSPPRGAADPEEDPVVFGREPAWPNAGAWPSAKATIAAPMVNVWRFMKNLLSSGG